MIGSCSESPEPQSLETRITQHLDQNEYEEALSLLNEADEDTAEVRRLKIRTHLAYATYLTHEADHMDMSERMSNALRHFRRVLELDEHNNRARKNIELIEGIYRQMGRDIPEGVAE